MSKAFDFAKSIKGSGGYKGLQIPMLASNQAVNEPGTLFYDSTDGRCEWYNNEYSAYFGFEEGAPTLRVLVVAGGGSGGSTGYGWVAAGGGGAGGFIEENSFAFVLNQAYTITVGAGGILNSNTNRIKGQDGSNSVYGTLTAIGGGGGAPGQQSYYGQAGSHAGNGGSGGGIGGYAQHNGCANIGTGTSGQGNDGGGPTCNAYYTGGGGGGAGSIGGDAIDNNTAGAGGDGRSSDITGSLIYYSGGGGGGNYNTSSIIGADGGSGSGGRGGYRGMTNHFDKNGQTPGGGGGGGAGYESGVWQYGGSGHNGIVVISMPSFVTPTISGITATSNTVIGNRRIVQFANTGTGTITYS